MPLGQTIPQPPQLFGSVCTDTQAIGPIAGIGHGVSAGGH
jgi:hypothetical protein